MTDHDLMRQWLAQVEAANGFWFDQYQFMPVSVARATVQQYLKDHPKPTTVRSDAKIHFNIGVGYG